MYNVLLRACMQNVLHTCLVTLESEEKKYIYEREKRYVNLPLIKLYLNSQIRSSIFPISFTWEIKKKKVYLSAM